MESFLDLLGAVSAGEDKARDFKARGSEAKPPEQQSVGIWHRDFYPQRCAPLDSYANDIKETGPRYIQWNLSLYDDEVLWVVPGSHVRAASPEEDACLRSGGVTTVPARASHATSRINDSVTKAGGAYGHTGLHVLGRNAFAP